ncbi:long-chain fatty acid transport protein 2-like [Diadema setosum]|uniref:long-chain fatty acid transport protein 2-like n=1 Tax=Diadema setosum TaxID=31175 RepID=UPI003B3A0106
MIGLILSSLVAAVLAALLGRASILSGKSDGVDPNYTVTDIAAITAGACVASIVASLAWIHYNYPLWLQDLKFVLKLARWNKNMLGQVKSGLTYTDIFEEQVRRHPDRMCLLYQDEKYTYAETDAQANRVAGWMEKSGLKSGDAVCLLLHNGPSFAWLVLGLMKSGIVASLLNTNLKPSALLYCLEVSEAKKLIFGSEFVDIVKEMLPELKARNVEAWMWDDGDDTKTPPGVVVMEIQSMAGGAFPRKAVTPNDTAIYIFTSGTTGMPKPVIIQHRKILRATFFQRFTALSPGDIYYISLPMYHSAALLQGTLSAWYYGATVALAKKFSASRFWDDIRRHKATGFHYVGELCRYLLAQPRKDNDGVYGHEVKFAQGNGLRPEIWREFQTRFKVGIINEMYGATEGNFAFINTDGKVGSVGRLPWLLQVAMDPVEIVDYDYASGEPKRGGDGLCKRLPRGKVGLAVNRITSESPFAGYKGSRDVTKKKTIANVKKDGDLYFNTGDLLLIDTDGYVYFKDRLGDTFRWKGENVSTTEVSQVVNSFEDISEANVYGVKIPGNEDGRAGMAAVVLKNANQFSWPDFYTHLTSFLPPYACPKFLRVVEQMDITGTFKHKKTALVDQGIDIGVIKDPIFVVDAKNKTFKPLTDNVLAAVKAGKLTL